MLWVLGWAVLVYAVCGAPGVYGRVLFSMHMVMHMAVAMLVPLLLVPAAPVLLALRALPARPDKTWGPREVVLQVVHSRALRVLANPVVAAALFFFSLAVFYYSPLFELALRTHTGHVLMMAHFLLTGYLFVWALVGIDPGPRQWSAAAAARRALRDDELPRVLRGRHDRQHHRARAGLLRRAAAAVDDRPARPTSTRPGPSPGGSARRRPSS